jgi:hypothetical protein
MMQPRLKHFGWGREGEGLTADEEAFVLGRIEQRFGSRAEDEVKPPELDDLKLEWPRINPARGSAPVAGTRPRTALQMPGVRRALATCPCQHRRHRRRILVMRGSEKLTSMSEDQFRKKCMKFSASGRRRKV